MSRAFGVAVVALILALGLSVPAKAGAPSTVPIRPGAPPAGDPFQGTSDGDQETADGTTDNSPDGGDEEDADESADSALHALTCLEGDTAGAGRRKGVQRRDFLKRHRFEVSGIGGFYASDTLSSTYSYGGALAYFPSEDFGLELLVTRSPVRFRLEEPFSGFDREQHFTPGVAWQGIASMLWSPIHAKMRFSDETIVHSDIFLVVGGGKTFHDSVQGLTWEAGAGIKLYLSRFVTMRIDVRDFLLPQEVLGRGRITNNVTVLAGVSLWLPG
ncbi:MAG TPA: outer membrane beta-barrel domain-containing protein [Polyangia bacterium]|nr:outer membrane beta-barrel domain-containing protein [Polyangia bacterium]